MGNPTGFMEFDLFERPYRPVAERTQHYNEFFIPLDDAELTRLGIPHQFYSYPGADHAFTDYNRDRYQKEASDIAWPRTLEFFAAHLKR